jgi:hypothetical protein
MASPARCASNRLSVRLAGCLLIAAGAAACNRNQSANQALDQQFKDNPQFTKHNTARFAGHVTVDGQPPEKDCKLFVILNDPQHLDENARLRAPRLYVFCDTDGKFAFGTYDKEDGVPAGKYVVTFAEFHSPPPKAPGTPRRLVGVSGVHYTEPDELKNLYNDPDQNMKDDKFNLNLQAGSGADLNFDLTVSGRDPVAAPGPNAVKSIIPPI